MEKMTACPRCGAKDDTEAEDDGLCCGCDDCPMTKAEDWNEALRLLNKEAEAGEQAALEWAYEQGLLHG